MFIINHLLTYIISDLSYERLVLLQYTNEAAHNGIYIVHLLFSQCTDLPVKVLLLVKVYVIRKYILRTFKMCVRIK